MRITRDFIKRSTLGAKFKHL